MPPASIGPFEIIATLGAGPKGTVYRARHVSHGRIVAVKHLSATVAPDSPEFNRLWNEVARLRAVVSSHVAATHSVELVDGRPAIEMESLGQSLEKVLSARPLGVRDALYALQDLLSGLKVLHDAGIVHGNLKPSNVLQDTTTGSWKVSDGGLTAIESQTAPTLLATSILYVAPETVLRLSGGGERSDLYSAGMMGLEAALGSEGLREAFPKVANLASPSRWLSWLEDRSQESTALHVLRPDTPLPVSQFFAKLLAKNPDTRFASAFAALVELESILPLLASPGTEILQRPQMAPEIPLLSTDSARGSTARLLITGPSGFDQQLDLSDRNYRIGREAQNDIVLPDETKAVSRMHAELTREGGRYVIVDLDSQNGVWVNGRRKTRVPLAPGVPVKIGGYTLSLSGESETAESAKDVNRAPAGAAATGAASPAPSATVRAGQAWWPPKNNQQWTILAAVAIVAIVVMAWIGLRDGSPAPDPEPPVTEAAADPTSSSMSAAELRNTRLASARELLGRKEFDAALREIDLVLSASADDQDALALKQEAVAGVAALTAAATTSLQPVRDPAPAKATARGARGSQPSSSSTPAVSRVLARRAGETETDWAERERRAAALYQRARSATDSGELGAAVSAWQALHDAEPSYPNLAVQLAAARSRLRDALTAAIQQGAKLEGDGELPKALEAFGRARDLDPASAEALGAFRRVGARMRVEGAKAFDDAEQYHASKRLVDAAREYRKAFEYLPDDDPKKKLAKERLDQIRKQIG